MAVIEPFDSTGVYRDDNGVKRYHGIADSVITLLRRTVEERPDQEAVVELDGQSSPAGASVGISEAAGAR